MTLKRIGKIAALGGVLALTVLLSSCYIAPDEITDNTQNMTVNGSYRPFDTVAPTTTATPTATPEPTTIVIGGETAQPTIDTNDGWGQNVATNTPAAVTAPPVAIVTTVPSTSTPIPAPATATPTATSSVLKKGSTGTRVRQIQQRLKDLGYYTGSVDGDYGDATVAAVKAFQKANGLTADGTIGTQTMTKLYSNSAKTYSATSTARATARRTATPKPTTRATTRATARVTATPRPTATPNLNRLGYLRTGSTGKSVRQLQERLIALGWMAGKADGTYGAATETAVKAFQKKTSGLYDDGIAGPETQRALYSSSAAKSKTPASVGGESIRPGAEGTAVRALQRQLKSLGYYTGSIDGSYGTGTENAVKAFQTNNGLTSDGIAGVATLNKLYDETAVAANGTSGNNNPTTTNTPRTNNTAGAGNSASAYTTTSSTGYTTQKYGSRGSSVTAIQQRLKELGYYTDKVDGKYGTSTQDAISAFQRINYLRVDGVAGPATQRKLFNYTSNTKYTTLREGDSSTSVAAMQQTLYEMGYYDGEISGEYDSLTAAAVREFQMNNNLQKIDGIAGNETLQSLYSSRSVGATAADTTYTTLRSGSKGESVVELQDVLRSLGYMEDITGVYDRATVNAVKSFQRNNNLSADGVAGAATQKLLYSGNPVPNY